MRGPKYRLSCIRCGSEFATSEIQYVCSNCGDLLSVEIDPDSVPSDLRARWSSRELISLWKYREMIPIDDDGKIVSLGEGGTKLYKCDNLARDLDLRGRFYIKFEGGNPTGSFKDRGMTVGVSKALEQGASSVICASTGNTSASMAAYSAKAGIRSFVVVPKGKIAKGKLAQALIYGATVIEIEGCFDDALRLVMEINRQFDVYLLNSVNPFRLEGQKTLAYEIWEQLDGEVPDWVVVPVGNAGNISAIWKGFKELYELGLVRDLPRMVGVQAKGAAPIADAIAKGKRTVDFIEKPETVATAIRIGKPVNWAKAIRAIRESNGTAVVVSDEGILRAQGMIASREGLFVEPASASAVAGLSMLVNSGQIGRDEVVICVATGHGLKDPDIVVKSMESKAVTIKPDLSQLVNVIKASGCLN